MILGIFSEPCARNGCLKSSFTLIFDILSHMSSLRILAPLTMNTLNSHSSPVLSSYDTWTVKHSSPLISSTPIASITSYL